MGRPNPARGKNPGGYGPRRPVWKPPSGRGGLTEQEMRTLAARLGYAGFEVVLLFDSSGQVVGVETDAPDDVIASLIPPAAAGARKDMVELGDPLPGNPPCPYCGESNCEVVDGHGLDADGAAVLVGGGVWRLAWHCPDCESDGWWMPAFAFAEAVVPNACPNCAGTLDRIDLVTRAGQRRKVTEEWCCRNRVDCGKCYLANRSTGMLQD